MAADIQHYQALRYLKPYPQVEQSGLIPSPLGTHSLGLFSQEHGSRFTDEAVKPTATLKTKPKSTL